MESANNKAIVSALYKALEKGQELETVSKLLASDLEWWFHGPPRCQHMMRMLTGKSGQSEFKFEPRNIEVVEDRVIAEGWEGGKAYWVHVWTLKDGLITQFREYFNTCLTVKKVDGGSKSRKDWKFDQRRRCITLWQSQPEGLSDRSLPGLLIAV